MILMFVCHYIVLVMIEWSFGIGLVNCVREQRRNSTTFTQASPSRLSESCRVSFLGFGSCFSPRRLVSGLSDQYSRLGKREARLSEVVMNPVRVEHDFLSRRGVLRVERTQSRSGECSPKRGVAEQPLVHTHSNEVV